MIWLIAHLAGSDSSPAPTDAAATDAAATDAAATDAAATDAAATDADPPAEGAWGQRSPLLEASSEMSVRGLIHRPGGGTSMGGASGSLNHQVYRPRSAY